MSKEYLNAVNVLENVNELIEELESGVAGRGAYSYERYIYRGYNEKVSFKISAVYEELSIFDWFNETLSLTQLRQMRKFLETAIDLGFAGYVCFKVGAKYCAHGMWAHKNLSTTGYSPDGDVLFHSFRSGDNYWDMELNGVWMHDKYKTEKNSCPEFTLAQIKAELANNK